MYRYSQTLPGGPVTLVGVLALSLLIPGWVAGALGLSALNALVVSWIFAHKGIFFIALLLLYDLLGLCILFCSAISIYVGYFVLVRALVAVRNWPCGQRCSRPVAFGAGVVAPADHRRSGEGSISQPHRRPSRTLA
jgi:hypothetical protein